MAKEPTGSGTVTVACKMPNGIVMRLFKMETGSELVMGGGSREVKKGVQIGNPVTLVGAARFPAQEYETPVIGGYGITHGVDAEFFSEWLKQNAHSELVKQKLVFAAESSGRVNDEARAMRTTRSGLEPVDPTKLPKGIETAPRPSA